MVDGAEGLSSVGTANTGLLIVKLADEITVSVTISVKPSLNPEGSDDDDGRSPTITFIYYWLRMVNPTYLQLETLVTLISHRFCPENSKHILIATNSYLLYSQVGDPVSLTKLLEFHFMEVRLFVLIIVPDLLPP
jgi:hypothetical protein